MQNCSAVRRFQVGMRVLSDGKMAEREGFEPPIPFRVCALSRRVPSATRPSLRARDGDLILAEGWIPSVLPLSNRTDIDVLVQA